MLRTFLFALLLFSASAANANLITFIHSGSGTGRIGEIAFEDASFTLTSTADTDDRQSFGAGYFINHFLAVIDIDGVGLFTFVTGTRTFINDDSDIVGFSRTSGADLFNGPVNGAFDGWDMTTSIGPIFGSGFLLQWLLSDVVTDGGILVFTSGESDASFQAIVHEVPTPATLSLMALAGLLMLRRQRR